MTRSSVQLGLLGVALVACSPSPSSDADDTAVDTSAPVDDRPTWWVSDEDGYVVYRLREAGRDGDLQRAILGLFGSELGDSVVPPLCAVLGQLCHLALPTPDDPVIVPVSAPSTASLSTLTWVGDALTVGQLEIPLRMEPEADLAYYGAILASHPDVDFSVSGDGEWGPFSVAAALTPPQPLDVRDARAFVHLNFDPTPELRWTPGDGDLVLEVRGPDGHHTLHLLDDAAGSAILDPGLPELQDGDRVHLDLFRVTRRSFEVGPNRLHTFAIAHQPMLGGSAWPASCRMWQLVQPGIGSGVQLVQPDRDAPPVEVWCDMETDGGGWTLVAATRGETLNDEAGGWHDELTTLHPVQAHPSVWDGLRPLIDEASDIRFACRATATQPDWTVDVSFYDVGWYREITTGTDADSCFSEGNGAGADDPPPARRDNVEGRFLAVGTPWAAGYLEGEDTCDDTDDFTVDLEDRGMDGNQSDGTDWGEDDGHRKCGVSGIVDGAWFIFVREPT